MNLQELLQEIKDKLNLHNNKTKTAPNGTALSVMSSKVDGSRTCFYSLLLLEEIKKIDKNTSFIQFKA